MFAYSPKKFALLYVSDLGQRIWIFLTRLKVVARLETACELNKRAVEGIEERLLEAFREKILADRVKQMVGHMVRQIFEQRDWELDQTDVEVQSVPFNKATRDRRPDWITCHAFRNTGDPRDVVLTDRRQNPAQPTDARWSCYATFASLLKAAVAFGISDIRQLRSHVHAHGYQRVHVKLMLRRV